MGMQVVKAVANAVTCMHEGRLKDVIRPGDIDWDDIVWDPEGTMWRRREDQVQHCFAIVWSFIFVNVTGDRICQDVFQYKGYEDNRGLALFAGGKMEQRRDLGFCLRDTLIFPAVWKRSSTSTCLTQQ